MMYSTHTKMPRNVGFLQAAAILYGDWGTSKAYVIGLALALAGYASFWLILCVGVLNIFVGLNYITICKYNPNGGGVYASARHRSKVLAILGAFFLIADYTVTAALSALSAFYYLGVSNPELWAIGAIVSIAGFNILGPRYSANLALSIAVPTFLVMILLGLMSLPFLETAIHQLQPLKGGFSVHWLEFTSIIVALSGIESIANITGVMKLDKGATIDKPSVTSTARKAILLVTSEVVILTTLFALASNALPGLLFSENMVSAPGEPEVRDYLLRYMGLVFGSSLLGTMWGTFFSYAVSLMIGILLLSAVNTAIVALESLLFIVSTDKELPAFFKRLNPYGVPYYALLAAALLPIALLLQYSDIAALADLYAVGFVGAIALNLGVTSVNPTIPLKVYERVVMFVTFFVMFTIEVTLLINKPHATHYVLAILAIGLFLRGLVVESYEKRSITRKETLAKHKLHDSIKIEETEKAGADFKSVMIANLEKDPSVFDSSTSHMHALGSFLCAVTHAGKTLEFAVEEAKAEKQLLYVLFVREQRVLTQADKEKEWWEDDDACKIVDYLVSLCQEVHVRFLYSVSDSAVDTIVESAHKTRVSRLILGISRKNKVQQLIQGNFISRVGKILSNDVDLIIIS